MLVLMNLRGVVAAMINTLRQDLVKANSYADDKADRAKERIKRELETAAEAERERLQASERALQKEVHELRRQLVLARSK